MPKSSIEMRTPKSRSLCRIASVVSLSCNSTDSVISSSSRCAGRPDAANAATTDDTRFGFLNCAGDRLTATLTSCDHPAASRHACRSTHSPIGTIRPVSSASGMKFDRRDHSAQRMVPAHQRLESNDSVAGESRIGW